MHNKFYIYLDVQKQWTVKEDVDNDWFEVTAYAATPNLDRQHDIIVKPALQSVVNQLKTVNTTVFYGHQYDRENTVGKILDAGVDDSGLWVRIYVSKTEPKLREKIKEGIISKLSIGGQVKSYRRLTAAQARELKFEVPEDVDEVRLVERIDIYEVSFVGVPANPHARVIDFTKSLYEVIQEQLIKGGDRMSELKKQEEAQKTEELKEESQVTSSEEKLKDEATEEEIKDLLEDEEEKGKDKEKYPKEKYPYYPYRYYYRYGKQLKEMVEKLGEAIAKLQETADKILEELKKKDEKAFQSTEEEEKNAASEELNNKETKDEKISEIKTKNPIETTKEIDPDERFLDWMKQ